MSASILFVDDDRSFLASLEDGLRAKRPDYDIMVAGDVPEAIRVLDGTDVDVVVTDLKMPGQGGFDLLAHMVERHPLTPCIVMTAYGTPETEREADGFGVRCVLAKPLDLGELQQQVDRALLLAQEKDSLAGVSAAGFLQLLTMERSTCTVAVSSEGRRGSLSLVDGRLVDARQGDLRGDDAVMEIATWIRPRMAVGELKRTPERTVVSDVPTLMMEALRRQDERRRMEDVEAERVDEAVARLTEIDGFLGVAVLRSSGTLLALRSSGAVDMDRIGTVACVSLRRAQRAAVAMGAGACRFLYMEGEEATVLCRTVSLGRAADTFGGDDDGLHVVLALSPAANTGMGRMRLNAAADSLLEIFGQG